MPRTAFPTAQSSFTKSNGGTVTAHHVSFVREKFDQFHIKLIVYINNPSQYDIVSMAKRFHIGLYAKYKNEKYMCCIFRLEEDFIWKLLQKTNAKSICHVNTVAL